jgi:aminoglycoside phosphotransferase (APT) family kinase protein
MTGPGSDHDSAASEDVARAAAAEVVNRHLGTPPGRLERENSGLSNFVFAVEHAAGSFVVRIAMDRARVDCYRKENWLVAHVRTLGVPVPRIVELGCDVGPGAYMLMERAPGAEATGHPQREKILKALGAHARRINAVATTGYGHVFDWADPGIPRHRSWKAFLAAELQLTDRLDLLVAQDMVDAAQSPQIRELVVELGAPPRAMSLNHGDLRLKNVVADDAGEIVAILDWENAISGPGPEWELSLALHDLSVDEKEAFLAGYALLPEEVERMAAALKALNVVNYAPHVRAAAEADDAEELARFRLRLRGGLDLHPA